MDDETHPEPGTSGASSFPMTSPSKLVRSPSSAAKEVRFKKTHRRNESKLSRISHLSIRSLKGGTIDEEDEADGVDEKELKPIYLFEFISKLLDLCCCMLFSVAINLLKESPPPELEPLRF